MANCDRNKKQIWEQSGCMIRFDSAVMLKIQYTYILIIMCEFLFK